jgi:hypothetical protein
VDEVASGEATSETFFLGSIPIFAGIAARGLACMRGV